MAEEEGLFYTQDKEALISKKSHCFIEPNLEESFRGYHYEHYSTKFAIVSYCGMHLAIFALMAVALSLTGHNQILRFLTPIFGAIATLGLLGASLVKGTLPRYGQEVCFVLVSVIAVVVGVIGSFQGTGWNSEELKQRYDPPMWPPVVLGLSLRTMFLLFSAVPWPRTFFFAGPLSVLEWIGLGISYPKMTSEMANLLAVLSVLGSIAVLVACGSSHWQNRRAYAAGLIRERERRRVALEKKVTDTLVDSIFPPELSQIVHSAKPEDICEMGFSKLIGVREYPVASVIVAHCHIDDDASDHVDTLTQLFVAADQVAERNGIYKVKSIGSSLVFVVGLPKTDPRHHKIACEAARDLCAIATSVCPGLMMSIGVASSPLVGGVISFTKPRFDIWGPAIPIAHQLAIKARPFTVLATREVVEDVKHFFPHTAPVPNVNVPSFGPVEAIEIILEVSSMDIVGVPSCALRLPRVNSISLASVAAANPPDLSPQLWPGILLFKTIAMERRFMDWLVANYTPHTRWVALIVAFIFFGSLGADIVILGFKLTRVLVHTAHLAIFIIIFFLTFIRPTRGNSALHLIVLLALTAICGYIDVFLYIQELWLISYLEGMLGFLFFVALCRLPFWISSPLAIVVMLGTIPLYIDHEYRLESAALLIMWDTWCQLSNWLFEKQMRSIFFSHALIEQSKKESRLHREVGQHLLRSIIPPDLLEQLESLSTGQNCFHKTLPSATIMVCQIVDLNGFYARYPTASVVGLLANFCNWVDMMSCSFNLFPLRFDGGRYVLVGDRESVGEESNSADVVVRLASKIVAELPTFNCTLNPVGFPITVRIGIHTSQIDLGVMRTKNFVYDCWGQALQVAEHLSQSAPDNMVNISDVTKTSMYTTARVLGKRNSFRIGKNGVQVNAFTITPMLAALEVATPSESPGAGSVSGAQLKSDAKSSSLLWMASGVQSSTSDIFFTSHDDSR